MSICDLIALMKSKSQLARTAQLAQVELARAVRHGNAREVHAARQRFQVARARRALAEGVTVALTNHQRQSILALVAALPVDDSRGDSA